MILDIILKDHVSKFSLRWLPSTYAANERTFLSWLSMATTIGTVGTAIAGFAVEDKTSPHKGGISQRTVQLITVLTLPIAIIMIAYALFTFYWRSEFIRRKQVGFFDDKVGPVSVALIVELALFVILMAALKDVFFG